MKKQAIVLIHGIGEQRPMNNLRAFVDTVWRDDPSVQHKDARRHGQVMWSKPDHISESFELRRITTIQSTADKRTEFFEMYWAHLMQGNRWHHVTAWVKLLLLRWPWTVPRQLLGLWLLMLAIALIVPLAALVGYVWSDSEAPGHLAWLAPAAAAIVAIGSSRLLVDRAGDAARYLNTAPPNIKCRHKIRTAGVQLLEELHNSGQYDRIVIVGHSLGSVIGYDMLTHYWARIARTPNGTSRGALDDLNRLSVTNPGSQEFRRAQDAYRAELNSQGIRWFVSDFVTLGSPLTHAQLLLATDRDDLTRRKTDRELPTCPPVGEGGNIAYADSETDPQTPNHAAVFGPTKWTNLYFPPRFLVHGDFIAGPIAPVLGSGVKDMPVRTSQRLGLFSHTLYWKPCKRGRPGTPDAPMQVEEHIRLLREAIAIA